MAAKSPSLRLASLAASVRTPNTGNFGKVIDAVEDMNAVLKQEEQVEIDQHAWCKENTFMGEIAKSRYEHKIEKTEAKMKKLNKKTEEELADAIVPLPPRSWRPRRRSRQRRTLTLRRTMSS